METKMSGNQEKYYGVAGKNAYGVYDDYARVVKAKKYIAGFKCKSFRDFEEAKYWAEIAYEDMQIGVEEYYEIEELERLNWCYYRKRIN